MPLESVEGFQYCGVEEMGPLWLMRAGSRLGVHFCGLDGWMESIVSGLLAYALVELEYLAVFGRLVVKRTRSTRRRVAACPRGTHGHTDAWAVAMLIMTTFGQQTDMSLAMYSR